MEVQVIQDLPKEFDRVEFYHQSEYLSYEAQRIGGEPFYFLITGAESEVFVLPLIKRSIPNTTYFDLTSPYGYCGYLSSSNDNVFINEAFCSFDNYCRENRIVSSFIRLNPIYNVSMLNETASLEHYIHGKVVTVPLKDDYSDILKNYSSNHKRNIKKLLKQGFTVEEANWDSIDEFISLYNETMTRLDASGFYFFPIEYYQMLFELGFDLKLLFVKSQNNEIISTALFLSNGEVIQYHLGGTSEQFIKLSPNKLIFDYIIKLYSTTVETARWFNLGGGFGGSEDSLFRFKKGFAQSFHRFSTVRMVHLKDQYDNLSKSKIEAAEQDNFFPAYRK